MAASKEDLRMDSVRDLLTAIKMTVAHGLMDKKCTQKPAFVRMQQFHGIYMLKNGNSDSDLTAG